ncbi:hypothetical protein PPERSA_05955 [Pseudocohnilembus persalinus]|uniref:Uncharacterized protein n=1 Tax=Pseudocohnilembus persalinus TaxID=266149 RepID=A0A0V0R468_PSEPJ|nr:hypothetical protein PPERSA_05955 [Pseudocohnilembus persalinus]|eukprot:KRX09286.1 hypothetical protein PPERSA_05955 [Pseudocohnilembus persalinus]
MDNQYQFVTQEKKGIFNCWKKTMDKFKSLFQSQSIENIFNDENQNLDQNTQTNLLEKISVFLNPNWPKTIWSYDMSNPSADQLQINWDTIYQNPDTYSIFFKQGGQIDHDLRRLYTQYIIKKQNEISKDKKANENSSINQQDEESKSLLETQENDRNINNYFQSQNNTLGQPDIKVSQYTYLKKNKNYISNSLKSFLLYDQHNKDIIKSEEQLNDLYNFLLKFFDKVYNEQNLISQLQGQQQIEIQESEEILSQFNKNFQLFLQNPICSLKKYQHLINQNIDTSKEVISEREICYIFKQMLKVAYKLNENNCVHVKLNLKSFSLFLNESFKSNDKQFQIKLSNFEYLVVDGTGDNQELNDYFDLLQKEIYKENSQMMNQKAQLFFDNNKQIIEPGQGLAFMLYQVSRQMIIFLLGIFDKNYDSYEKTNSIEDKELSNLLNKILKKQISSQIFNLINKLFDPKEKQDLNQNRILNQIPSYNDVPAQQGIGYTDSGVVPLQSLNEYPLFIVYGGEHVMNEYNQWKNQQIQKAQEGSIKEQIKEFNHFALLNHQQILNELMNKIMKDKSFYLEKIENEFESNEAAVQFYINLAHLAIKQNYFDFSQKCTEKSFEFYQKGFALKFTNKKILTDFLQKYSEIITLLMKKNSELSFQEYDKNFIGIKNILYVFSEAYHGEILNNEESVNLIYIIQQSIVPNNYGVYIYIWELILQLEKKLNNKYLQAQALVNLAKFYGNITYYDREQNKMSNFFDKSLKCLEEALDLLNNLLSESIDHKAKEGTFNFYLKQECLKLNQQIFLYQSEIYRLGKQTEKINPVLQQEYDLVLRNKCLIFQIDSILANLASNEKKKQQTQEQIRNWLLDIQSQHNQRQAQGHIKEFPNNIYNLSEYLHILIGTTYFLEENYDLSCIHYNKFLVPLFEKLKGEKQLKGQMEKLTKIYQGSQWKSWIYYVKFMSQSFHKKSDNLKAFILQNFYAANWGNTNKLQWKLIVARYSSLSNNKFDYFKINPEQHIWDVLNLRLYAISINQSMNDQYISQCMNIIFHNYHDKNKKVGQFAVKQVLIQYIEFMLSKFGQGKKFGNFLKFLQEIEPKEQTPNIELQFAGKIKQYLVAEYIDLVNEIIQELKITSIGQDGLPFNDIAEIQINQLNYLVQIAENYQKLEQFFQAKNTYRYILIRNQEEKLDYSQIKLVQFKEIQCNIKAIVKVQGHLNINQAQILGKTIVDQKQQILNNHFIQSQYNDLLNYIKSHTK